MKILYSPEVDLLHGGGSPEPEPEPVARGRKARICCDFCQCELAADGGVLKTSDKARDLERAERTISDLRSNLQAAEGTVETLRAELEAKNAPAPALEVEGDPGNKRHVAKPLSSYVGGKSK